MTRGLCRSDHAYLNCTDSRLRFLNLDRLGKPGVLIAHVSPPWAEGYRPHHTSPRGHQISTRPTGTRKQPLLLRPLPSVPFSCFVIVCFVNAVMSSDVPPLPEPRLPRQARRTSRHRGPKGTAPIMSHPRRVPLHHGSPPRVPPPPRRAPAGPRVSGINPSSFSCVP